MASRFLKKAFFLTLCLMGCEALADRGINSVSIQYGVRYSDQSLAGATIINADSTMSGDPKGHTNAELELEILHIDGEIEHRRFMIGALPAGQTWTRDFDRTIRDVATVRFRYRTDQGAASGTLEIPARDP
jgi:hypothetical protein